MAREPATDHARLREREGEKDSDGIERDESVSAAAEDHEEERRRPPKDEDAVGEDEAIPARAELPREEAVPGQEEGQSREIGEGRVGREHQDEHGGALDEEVEEALPEDLAGELGDDGLLDHRSQMVVPRQERDAHEERDEDDAEPPEHDAGVPGFRRLEGGNAVGDGLHAGEGRAPRGEGPEDEKDGQVLRGGSERPRRLRGHIPRQRPAHEPVEDEDARGTHEEIGGQREELARLAQAAEVGEGDRRHEADADGHAIVEEGRNGRGEGGHAGGHAHGDGEHVVDEERPRRDEAGQRPQVVLGDDVRAAALRVGEDGLAVRAHHHRDQDGDGHADGDGQVEGRAAREHEDEEDFFRRVGHGGQRVGGEYRERRGLGEPLVTGLGRGQRAPDHEFLERVEIHRRFSEAYPSRGRGGRQASGAGSRFEMKGHVDDDEAGPEEERPLDEERRLIVQDVLPPVARHEFGDDNGDDLMG